VIKKNNTKEEVVMKKHVAARPTGLRTPKMLLGMTQNLPEMDLGAKQTKVVQITSALKKEMVRREPRTRTRSILIKKVLTNSQIAEEAELGSMRLVEQLPEPEKMVDSRKPPPRSPKANVTKRRPKLFEGEENGSTKMDPTTRPTANNVRAAFGSRQPLKQVEQNPEPVKVIERATSRSLIANTTKGRPKLFEKPKHVSPKSKEHNFNARPTKNTKQELIDVDERLDRRGRRLGKEERRRPKLLKTTTESPEAWLDRFYSKNIRTVPRKMVSSVKLFTSVDDGNEEEKEKGRTNPSSSSHSERKALRELLALVGSEEATLVEAPTTTTTRKPVLITTSAPRIKLSSQTSSTTKAKTQESNNFILQMTKNKEEGKIKNNNNNNFKLNTNSNVEEEAKMKPKDFLLKMMLLSQDTNSVIKSDSVLQPLNKAKVETKKKTEEIATKKTVSGKKEAWQAVSSLTTTFERGNKEKDEEDVFNEEGGFGDNLQLIFKQDDTQQAEHLPRAQEPVLHVEHGEGEAELRMEDSAQLNLDSDFDSAQGEMDHQHHLEQSG